MFVDQDVSMFMVALDLVWIALWAVVLCRTGTEQTVISLTGLVQRTQAQGHAINRSGGPQSLVVTTRVRRINPCP